MGPRETTTRRTPIVLATVLTVASTLDLSFHALLRYSFRRETPEGLQRSSTHAQTHTAADADTRRIPLKLGFPPSVVRMSFVRDVRCARGRIREITLYTNVIR